MNKQYRRETPRALQMAMTALLALGCGVAQAAVERTLESVEHVALPGEEVQITLNMSDTAPVPKVFTVANPARLSVDLPETKLGTSSRYVPIDIGNVRSVALAESGNRTRVVVEFTQVTPYSVTNDGNRMHIHIGKAKTAGNQTPNVAAPVNVDAAVERASLRSTEPAARIQTATGPSIRDIDFRRSEQGAGRVVIEIQGVNGPVDVQEEGGKIIARFPNTVLPAALSKRLDVIDFATPVKYIDALNRNGDARLVITPINGADFEQVAYQTDTQFTIELQPLTASEIERRQLEKPKYTGERVSLSFQDVPVRALLQIIADVAEVNMVVSDSVSGSMALRLENVPWDQALDIILKSKGLGMQREGNVVLVAPLPEIAAREQAELAAQQATTNLAPLRSEIIQVNYARAGDMAALLKSGEISLLSERGQVTTDTRTNTLLINETRAKLEEIRRLIERLDIPVRQVLIESRIVVANRDFSRSLGVSSDVSDAGAIESPDGGNLLTDTGFTVALPVAAAAGILSTSILGDTFNLDLALSALESENNGEVISSPRVITANAAEASIEQGVEIPFLEAASSGAATVSFKEAVLSLTVTPQITPDERVIMDLFVTQDTQGPAVNVQGGGLVPSINTRSLSTQVLVDDGETVVLGGIYEQEDRDGITRVPVLGEIPLLGFLFRTTTKQRNKQELLLFVTPKILKQGLTLN